MSKCPICGSKLVTERHDPIHCPEEHPEMKIVVLLCKNCVYVYKVKYEFDVDEKSGAISTKDG